MDKIKILRKLLPNWIVNTFWHLPVAWAAAVWYRFPASKLVLIGVTGTDGKTTTVYLINHILKSEGYKTVLVSSVAAEINGKKKDTGLHVTSPHPFQVQKYLREAVDKKVTHAILEVTSHGIEQYRFAGCDFDYGILTNIRPDHLDYHKTFKNYLSAKVKLLRNAKTAIINKDDESFKSAISCIPSTGRRKVITYGIDNDADFTPNKLNLKKQPSFLPGKYNLYNILAAYALASDLGIMKNKSFDINTVLDNFQGVPGRFEEVETGENFRVIIDFAHTPYALRELLTTLRGQLKKGRIIAVFGCAAERGKQRRKMGKVAAELADITVITAEDPRFEGVKKISEDIAKWAVKGGAEELEVESWKLKTGNLGGRHVFVRIPDRQEAINFAVKTAKREDIVVLCGKGHEKSMNFKGKEKPWDERKAVEKALSCIKS